MNKPHVILCIGRQRRVLDWDLAWFSVRLLVFNRGRYFSQVGVARSASITSGAQIKASRHP